MPKNKKAITKAAPKNRAIEILVLPDLHVHPGSDHDLADIISRMLDEVRPDVCVNLGDHWDFPSLAFQTKGQASSIGHTFKADLSAGLKFQEKMFDSYAKAKQRWNMRRVFCEGNHESRMRRTVETDWALADVLSLDSLQLDRHYSDIVPYQGSTPGMINIGGVNFCHYAVSGSMCKAIASVHLGAALINKSHASTVMGHSHLLSYATQIVSDASKVRRLHGLSAGCLIAERDHHSYAGVSQSAWVRGCAFLDRVEDGDFDLEWISLRRMREKWGS